MALALDRSSSADDGTWIAEAARRDSAEAFDLLYRHYAEALRRFCASRVGESDADDACHEALLRAHRALPRFREGAPMWPWLATIAANVCIDLHRSRRCEPLPEERPVHESAPTDPHGQVELRLRRELLDDALRSLPRRYRAPIVLCDLEGWSYGDIAELDGTTVATVRGNLHRGRTALRQRIRELAERRGMWPLSALLPGLPALRLRPRRRRSLSVAELAATRADVTSVVLPSLPTLLPGIIQTAAAAVVVTAVALGPRPAAAAEGEVMDVELIGARMELAVDPVRSMLDWTDLLESHAAHEGATVSDSDEQAAADGPHTIAIEGPAPVPPPPGDTEVPETLAAPPAAPSPSVEVSPPAAMTRTEDERGTTHTAEAAKVTVSTDSRDAADAAELVLDPGPTRVECWDEPRSSTLAVACDGIEAAEASEDQGGTTQT